MRTLPPTHCFGQGCQVCLLDREISCCPSLHLLHLWRRNDRSLFALAVLRITSQHLALDQIPQSQGLNVSCSECAMRKRSRAFGSGWTLPEHSLPPLIRSALPSVMSKKMPLHSTRLMTPIAKCRNRAKQHPTCKDPRQLRTRQKKKLT